MRGRLSLSEVDKVVFAFDGQSDGERVGVDVPLGFARIRVHRMRQMQLQLEARRPTIHRLRFHAQVHLFPGHGEEGDMGT